MSVSVSIFTPTYNRAHILGRAYQSLLAQTCKDFEWVIADDGSADNTAELVKSWQAEAPFPIRYFQFPHRGKPYAMRDGFQKCEGKYLYELDSDDEMVPTAVERGLALWASLDHPEEYHDVNAWGWIPELNQPTGQAYPDNINDLSIPQQRALNKKLSKGHCGEQRSFRVTRHCQEYPFPIPEGLTFIPENAFWDRIYCDYKRFYTNEFFMLYHWQEQPDSLMKTVKDARPAYFFYLYHLNDIYPRDPYATLANRMKARIGICYAARRCKFSLGRMIKELTHPLDKVLCGLFYFPVALMQKVHP